MDIISSKKFTSRELEVLACIIHNRGDKKIASLLDISPRTVGSHVRNIMLKSEANSKDAIRDFIESTGSINFIRNIYNEILLNSCFRKHLALVRRQIITSPIDIKIIIPRDFDQKLLERLLPDCALAGLILEVADNYDSAGNTDILKDFDKNKYHESIFDIIHKISDKNQVKNIYQDFKSEHTNLQIGRGAEYEHVSANSDENNTKKFLILGLFILLLIIMIVNGTLNSQPRLQVRPNLIVPNEDILVNRKSELKKIDKIFSDDKNKISIMVLTGAPGSGKSILARLYAKSQNNPIIWEIDASNMDNMTSSFERLADAIKMHARDNEEMDYISRIKDPKRKMKKLESFISKKTMEHPKWLLIYNSVNRLKDINQYFPHDHKKWGVGKVIITTNNSNIAQSDFVPENNILKLGELSYSEKDELFKKILGKHYDEDQSESKIKLIEELLPYPLDIRNAANLIKNTKLPYSEYSKILANEPNELSRWEEDFQSDTSSYDGTRYKLITASIDEILEENKEYHNLLLLINSVNSENIPRNLILDSTSEVKARQLINNIKDSAFVREKDAPEDFFSIHNSVQTISRFYLLELSKKQGKKNALEPGARLLNAYAEKKLKQEDIQDIRNLIPHMKKFTTNYKEHSGVDHLPLTYNLGKAYFDIGDYKNSRIYFERAHRLYAAQYGKSDIRTASVKSRLGVLYRNLGLYEDSLKLLRESYHAYKHHFQDSDNNPELAKASIRLGSAYRNLKQYDKALKYTEKGMKIYEATYEPDSIEIAWAKAYLACILGHIGQTEQALEKLKFAHMQYSKQLQNAPIKRAWLSVRLGMALKDLGQYTEAEKHFKYALDEYKLNVSENSIELAWNMAHLGILHNKAGRKILAKKYLSKARAIYANNIGLWPKDHQTINWVKENLAQI